jgi:hypothetical protein
LHPMQARYRAAPHPVFIFLQYPSTQDVPAFFGTRYRTRRPSCTTSRGILEEEKPFEAVPALPGCKSNDLFEKCIFGLKKTRSLLCKLRVSKN